MTFTTARYEESAPRRNSRSRNAWATNLVTAALRPFFYGFPAGPVRPADFVRLVAFDVSFSIRSAPFCAISSLHQTLSFFSVAFSLQIQKVKFHFIFAAVKQLFLLLVCLLLLLY